MHPMLEFYDLSIIFDKVWAGIVVLRVHCVAGNIMGL
jgi:hypothetical protein